MAEALDLVVDRRVLLDVGVGLRDIGLWLVVVVIGDEVLDGVAREELLNSLASWAASDLFGAMTRVGFWTFSMTLAMVNVLPVPVTPRSVW